MQQQQMQQAQMQQAQMQQPQMQQQQLQQQQMQQPQMQQQAGIGGAYPAMAIVVPVPVPVMVVAQPAGEGGAPNAGTAPMVSYCGAQAMEPNAEASARFRKPEASAEEGQHDAMVADESQSLGTERGPRFCRLQDGGPADSSETPSAWRLRPEDEGKELTQAGDGIEGLQEWLQQAGLGEFQEAVSAWCKDMGAIWLSEVQENAEELADHLQLCPAERLATLAMVPQSCSG
ncbi:unnamed protein product [Effrenium voratum]|uniref:SAM domain-containing protein n=1 Tax=Effrenium voratum TaxID=2562239 RepID=A0AA36NFM2_9DINO|nr:unnamed protein product [Effrenium voratum]